jgi:hypothetical protein
MPTIIPRSPGPQVQQQAAPQVRNTAQVDYSPAIRSGQVLGGVVADYAQREKEKGDLTALMAARRELSDWEGNTFRPDNPDGIAKYQGKDSLNAANALLPDLDNRVSQIRQRLTRDQQAKFDQVAYSFRDSVQGRVAGYADREYTAYESAERKATLENIAQDSISAAVSGDYGLAETRVQEALGIARAAYQAQGFGEEAIKASERGIVSSVRKQTVEGMMTRDPFAAEDYYQRYADQMTPEDRAATERTLLPYVEDRQADADATWAEQGGADPDRVPAARGKPSPEVAAALDEAAAKHGVPREYMYALAEQESGMNPKAKNPEALDDGDHAEGLFQYRRTTSAELGNFDRSDPGASADAAARQFKERMDKHGPDYAIAAHFAGDGGADAVVNRGRAAENPKTALYVRQVRGRAARWRAAGADPDKVAAPGPAASKADALARVNALADPRRRQAAERRLKDRWEVQKLQHEDAEKATGLAVYEKVTQAGAATPLSQILTPDEMALVGRSASLNESIERFRKLQASGTIVQDDPVTLDRLYRLQATDPSAFARTKLAEYSDKLSGATMKKLADDQQQVSNATKRADWLTEDERLNTGFRLVGIGKEGDAVGKDSTKKNEPREKQRGEFRIAYNNAMTELMQQLGAKKPTPEQADTLVRSVARRFAERTAAKTTGVYSAGEQYQLQITEADRTAVRDAYRAKNGSDPTDAWVTQYITKKRGAAK